MSRWRAIVTHSAAAWQYLRLAGAIALLLVSLLALLPAPTYRLWLLAIAVTEFGHYIAPVALLWLWPGWQRSRSRRLSVACAAVAAACFLSPVVRGLVLAQRLPAQLDAAFGLPGTDTRPDVAGRGRPLDPALLFLGTPPEPVEVRTLRYAARDEGDLEMDLYLPPPRRGTRPAPIVLMIHGGGWAAGRRDDLAALNHHLARLGYLVVAPSYRFAPAHPFPAAYDDVRAALAIVRGRAREWNGDPERIAVIGRSAGSQLALLTAYQDTEGAIRGVVAFYGPADLRFAWEHPGNPMVYDGLGTVERYLGGPPAAAGARYDEASPYQFVGATTPPTLLIHGRRDEIVWVAQSVRLADRLQAHARPHLLVAPGWATHGCDFNFSGPCGQISTYAIERFLAAVL